MGCDLTVTQHLRGSAVRRQLGRLQDAQQACSFSPSTRMLGLPSQTVQMLREEGLLVNRLHAELQQRTAQSCCQSDMTNQA